MSVRWRAMEETDLDAVLGVADRVHPDYPEDRAVFAERLRLFPAGCRVAEREGCTLGYGVMHPGLLGVPPPLDAPLGALPAAADCLYLHDIALLPETRGLGLGAALLDYAHALAARVGLGRLALTSTPGARRYWQRVDFAPYEDAGYGDAGSALAAKLASYGGGMTYMTAPVRRR